MPLYHSCSKRLNSGELVFPGNWGKVIHEWGPRHNCWDREQRLEEYRLNHYPDKPCRFRATYCCESLEAVLFHRRHHAPNSYIYEVEHIYPEMPSHKGDFNAVQPPSANFSWDKIGHGYWGGKLRFCIEGYSDLLCDEIVSESPIRIICQILSPEEEVP